MRSIARGGIKQEEDISCGSFSDLWNDLAGEYAWFSFRFKFLFYLFCIQGLEGYFRDSGFDQKTVRESEK